MSERKRRSEAVRDVIRAAEEPRPVLFAWLIGMWRLLKRGREDKCA
jgi:hypothetical protein